MSGEIAKIYKMGIYHFKWPDTIIIKLDTLKRNIENQQIKVERLNRGIYCLIIDGKSTKLIKN